MDPSALPVDRCLNLYVRVIIENATKDQLPEIEAMLEPPNAPAFWLPPTEDGVPWVPAWWDDDDGIDAALRVHTGRRGQMTPAPPA